MLDLSTLSPQQYDFVTGTKRKSLYEGAFRSGKTWAGCFRAVLLAYNFPKNRILIARKTYRRLFDTTVNTFYEVCPPELIAYERKSEAKIFLYDRAGTTSEIMWRSLERAEDFGEIKNLDLGAVWLDQAEEFPEEVYKMLLSRLTLGGIDYRSIFLTANPPPNEEHWLAKQFPYKIELAETQRVFEGPDWKLIIGEMNDNREHLPEKYQEELASDYSDDMAEVYIRGRRGRVRIGKPIFTEFSRRLHVLPQAFEPIKWQGVLKGATRYFRSWDFGRVRPGMVWGRAVYPPEQDKCYIQIMHEYLGDNITTPALASLVKEESTRCFPFVTEWTDLGDPRSAYKANEATGTRIVDLLTEQDIKLVQLERSDPSGRADLINSWLAQNVGGHTRLQVMAGEPVLIGGLDGGYHRRKPVFGKPVDDTPVKDGFYEHIIDALGFAIQYFEGPSRAKSSRKWKRGFGLVGTYNQNRKEKNHAAMDWGFSSPAGRITAQSSV